VAENEGLGRWARRRARGELKDVGARFDVAMQTWRAVGEPEAQLLEARRRQVAPEVARLEKAQTAREAFLAEHPDIPERISDLCRATEAREQLENMRRSEILRERRQARQFGRSVTPHTQRCSWMVPKCGLRGAPIGSAARPSPPLR